MAFFDKGRGADIYATPAFDETRKSQKKLEIIQALLGGGQQVPLQSYGPLNAIADVLSKGVLGYKANKAVGTEMEGMEKYRTESAAAGEKLSAGWDNRDAIIAAISDPYVGEQASDRAKDFKDSWVDAGRDPASGATIQRNKTNNKLDYGPQPSKGQSITVNTGKASEKLLEYALKFMEENATFGETAPTQFAQTERAKQAIQEGTTKGNLSAVTQGLAQFAHSLGADLDPKTANMQIVKTAMAPLALAEISKLKPASNTDLTFVTAMVGQDASLISDADAIELFNVYQRALQRRVEQYNKVKSVVPRLAAGEVPGPWVTDLFSSLRSEQFGDGKDPATLPSAGVRKPPTKTYRYDAEGNPIP